MIKEVFPQLAHVSLVKTEEGRRRKMRSERKRKGRQRMSNGDWSEEAGAGREGTEKGKRAGGEESRARRRPTGKAQRGAGAPE